MIHSIEYQENVIELYVLCIGELNVDDRNFRKEKNFKCKFTFKERNKLELAM